MPTLALLFKDTILAQAIDQQLVGLFETRLCAAWEAAAKADLLLAEAIALPTEKPAQQPPLVFVISAGGEKIPPLDITESFGKPIRLGHLIARLQWQWTAFERHSDRQIRLGDCALLPHERRLTYPDGTEARLTEKETALLAYLAEAPAPVPRDVLLAEIWGYDGRIDTHTLETHIYRLRSLAGIGDLLLVKQGTYQIISTLRNDA